MKIKGLHVGKGIAWLIPYLMLAGCNHSNVPEISFYYWKSRLPVGETERKALADNNVKRLYVRYFDVILDELNQPAPEAVVAGKADWGGLQIVPVVYLRNRVFERLSVDSVVPLARQTVSLIRQINAYYHIRPAELQFDCDWSLTTRDRFFRFLRECRKLYPASLSATIRLHQVKFATRTGVPPVDRGVLMYYNMGEIAPDTLNSVYDRKIALRYLSRLKNYPLPLDVALPVYSWGVRVRQGRVVQLLSKVAMEDLEADARFRKLGGNRFEVVQPCFLKGFYFKEGDVVKVEYVESRQLQEMAGDISSAIRQCPGRLLFFDLDASDFKRYEKTIFKKVANRFD